MRPPAPPKADGLTRRDVYRKTEPSSGGNFLPPSSFNSQSRQGALFSEPSLFCASKKAHDMIPNYNAISTDHPRSSKKNRPAHWTMSRMRLQKNLSVPMKPFIARPRPDLPTCFTKRGAS